LPLLSETDIAFAVALFSDTVQVLVALLPSVDGAQEIPFKWPGCWARWRSE